MNNDQKLIKGIVNDYKNYYEDFTEINRQVMKKRVR
jgi:hypothetical protein